MFVFKTRKFQFKLVGIDVQFFTADVFLYFKFKILCRYATNNSNFNSSKF